MRKGKGTKSGRARKSSLYYVDNPDMNELMLLEERRAARPEELKEIKIHQSASSLLSAPGEEELELPSPEKEAVEDLPPGKEAIAAPLPKKEAVAASAREGSDDISSALAGSAGIPYRRACAAGTRQTGR